MSALGITTVPALEGSVMLAVTSMMAEAFHYDPMQEWLFPNGRLRTRRLRRVYELDVLHRLNGHAMPHLAEHRGVAFWHPPGEAGIPARSVMRLAPGYQSVLAHHPIQAGRLLRDVVRHHPKEPHWYLSHLAVADNHKRMGVGRRLLDAGTERADRDGVGTYLETANPANLRFYAAAGFGQVGLIRIADAPPVWLLWRQPH